MTCRCAAGYKCDHGVGSEYREDNPLRTAAKAYWAKKKQRRGVLSVSKSPFEARVHYQTTTVKVIEQSL